MGERERELDLNVPPCVVCVLYTETNTTTTTDIPHDDDARSPPTHTQTLSQQGAGAAAGAACCVSLCVAYSGPAPVSSGRVLLSVGAFVVRVVVGPVVDVCVRFCVPCHIAPSSSLMPSSIPRPNIQILHFKAKPIARVALHFVEPNISVLVCLRA